MFIIFIFYIMFYRLEKIAQSNASFVSGNTSLVLKLTHIVRHAPQSDDIAEHGEMEGSARLKNTGDFATWFSRKNCFFRVLGTQCLPRALVAARYLAENHAASSTYRMHVHRLARDPASFMPEARELCERSGVNFSLPSMGLRELQKLVAGWSEYRVHVYSTENFGRLGATFGE